MRAEIHGAGVARARSQADERCGSAAEPSSSTRLDPFDLLVLLAFAAISMWVLVLDLHRAAVHGLVWTGTDGFYIVDQMQYLAWIRDASHHLLASNLFVLRGTPADYFQPAVAISGVLTALGRRPLARVAAVEAGRSPRRLLWRPRVRAAEPRGHLAASGGDGARAVLRLVHDHLREHRRPRRPVRAVPFMGLYVRAARTWHDAASARHLRWRATTGRPDPPARHVGARGARRTRELAASLGG